MEIIVGTAGHIDHGKTALVRALTGTDADRLPEEKARGITIDIGFAELEVGDVHFGFVDVPGHERFIKNMLAGASGIDVVMLVIAADEGVMPQTREHFEICRLLGLTHGVVVLTKRDMVDDEMLELARLDAAELVAGSFLDDAPVVAVSSITGVGIDELTETLAGLASGKGERSDDVRATFLPIDRSFTVKGFGAVVTGTLAHGEIAEGTELELLPGQRRARVRGLHTHGRSVKAAHAGQRTAINLGGIDHSALSRGMAVAEPDVLRPTQIFDAEVELLGDAPRPMRSRQRVRIHIGTAEILARVFVMNAAGEIPAGEVGHVQFRLESPVACAMADRFIIRSYSPQRTIGGGKVFVPHAEKHKRRDIPAAVAMIDSLKATVDDRAKIAAIFMDAGGENGISILELRAQTGWKQGAAEIALAECVAAGGAINGGGRFVAVSQFDALKTRVLDRINRFHRADPLARGISRETLREQGFRYVPPEVFDSLLALLISDGKLVGEKDLVRFAGHQTEMSADEKAVSGSISSTLRDAKLEPPKLSDVIAEAIKGTMVSPASAQKLVRLLLGSGAMTMVTDEYYFDVEAINELKAGLRSYADTSADRTIDVARFKEIAGVSRKYAIPLLEYFDRERVTIRAGDKRVILK